MSSRTPPRPLDELLTKWAAPVLRAEGFKEQHRRFRWTGSGGQPVGLQFRLHPLTRDDTFFIEWEAGRFIGMAGSRLDVPPAMSANADTLAALPDWTPISDVDLWHVSRGNLDVVGLLLQDQLTSWMPYWKNLADPAEPAPSDRHTDLEGRQGFPFPEGWEQIVASVKQGRAEAVADLIRRAASERPDNDWTRWWLSLL